jgi:hypothetical protein
MKLNISDTLPNDIAKRFNLSFLKNNPVFFEPQRRQSRQEVKGIKDNNTLGVLRALAVINKVIYWKWHQISCPLFNKR